MLNGLLRGGTKTSTLHYHYSGDLHSGSVFGVGIRRRTGRPRYLCSIPGRGNRFVFSPNRPSGSGPHELSYSVGTV